MKYSILIPARLESTRLPRKLLLDDTGHPLIWHSLKNLQSLRDKAQLCLVTDDEGIKKLQKVWLIFLLSLRKDHQSGTERITEVLDQVRLKRIGF